MLNKLLLWHLLDLLVFYLNQLVICVSFFFFFYTNLRAEGTKLNKMWAFNSWFKFIVSPVWLKENRNDGKQVGKLMDE